MLQSSSGRPDDDWSIQSKHRVHNVTKKLGKFYTKPLWSLPILFVNLLVHSYGEELGRSRGGAGEELGRSWGGAREEQGRSWGGAREELGRSWGGARKELGRS